MACASESYEGLEAALRYFVLKSLHDLDLNGIALLADRARVIIRIF
jgi:hypothetical protein